MMEPNFVLMKLPGEPTIEFVEILPFTPSNRNNMIGWIAGRSDGSNYGTAVVYNFPKSKLIDGPLQIEARIDQDPQLSGQLSLWNQQGSHVRRGSLIVIPAHALLYAEPIYLRLAEPCRSCAWSCSRQDRLSTAPRSRRVGGCSAGNNQVDTVDLLPASWRRVPSHRRSTRKCGVAGRRLISEAARPPTISG
jgi:hypothetical protein